MIEYLKNRRGWFYLRQIRENRALIMGFSIAFILLSSLYHYLLLCQYPPMGEDLMSISLAYSHLHLGTEYYGREILWMVSTFLAVQIGGMSYFAMRLHWVFLYSILLCETMFLCLTQKQGGRIKLYCIFLVGLFAVVLFPAADAPTLFQVGCDDLSYFWLPTYHYPARIYAVACLLLLFLAIRCKGRKGRVVYATTIAVISLYALKWTDLIFVIMFLAPAVIVLFLRLFHKAETRKYAVFLFVAGMFFLLLSRILPLSTTHNLWTKAHDAIYEGPVYGSTNWTSWNRLGERVLSYLRLLGVTFNIQIEDMPVISLHTVVALLKIAILAVGYMLMFHIIKCSLHGKGKEHGYDFVDEILAWSYLMLSCIYLFTEFGEVIACGRYFSGMTTVMTILLCRNLELIPRIGGWDTVREIGHKRELFFICTMILCICSTGKIWKEHATDVYGDELKAIVEYIEATQYGYTVANYWTWPHIQALSGGQVMAYESQDDIRQVYGDDAKIAYIITNNTDNPDHTSGHSFYFHCNSYEEICEYYSAPTRIINYDKLQLVVYENGIQITE